MVTIFTVIFNIIMFCITLISITLPWVYLDDTSYYINGLDLAVYWLVGPDKMLYLQQDMLAAIMVFLLSKYIIIMSVYIYLKHCLKFNREVFIINHCINCALLCIPIAALLFYVSNFTDENYILYNYFSTPGIGLILLFIIPALNILFQICMIFFQSLLNDRIDYDIINTDQSEKLTGVVVEPQNLNNEMLDINTQIDNVGSDRNYMER